MGGCKACQDSHPKHSSLLIQHRMRIDMFVWLHQEGLLGEISKILLSNVLHVAAATVHIVMIQRRATRRPQQLHAPTFQQYFVGFFASLGLDGYVNHQGECVSTFNSCYSRTHAHRNVFVVTSNRTSWKNIHDIVFKCSSLGYGKDAHCWDTIKENMQTNCIYQC